MRMPMSQSIDPGSCAIGSRSFTPEWWVVVAGKTREGLFYLVCV
jgi:hypothetical protein